MIAEKRKLRRHWQYTLMRGHQARATQDKTNPNRITQQLTRGIKALKSSSINKFLTDLAAYNSTEYSLWITIKYLRRAIAQIIHPKNQWTMGTQSHR